MPPEIINNTELRLKIFFDKLPVPLLIIDVETGLIIDANEKAEIFYGYTKDEFQHMTIAVINPFIPADDLAIFRTKALNEGYNQAIFKHKLKDGSIKNVETNISLILYNNEHYILAVITDITEKVQAQERARRLYDFNAALAKINEFVADSKDENEMFKSVCESAVKLGNLKLAYIAKPDESGRLQFLASAGETGYLDDVFISVNADIPEGQGTSGKTWRKQKSCYIQSFASSPFLSLWKERAERFGVKSTANLPILRNGEIWALFGIYHNEENIFDDDLKILLEETAKNISRGLSKIDAYKNELKLRNALEQERDLFKVLIENIHSGIALYNQEKFIYVNSAILDLFHYSKEEFLNLNVNIFFNIKEENLYYSNTPIFKPYFNKEFSSRFIYQYLDEEKIRYIDLFRTAITYNNEQTGLAIFADVTDQILKEQHILIEREEYKELSEIDALTGINNRRSFDNKLAELLNAALRYNRPLSLIMFDIDHFKNINDAYGHETGDFILKEISALIKENLRSTDFFARYGGEEFMIISPETSIPTAKELTERLRLKIEKHNFNIGDSITCSFGITDIEQNDTSKSIVYRVDAALYNAKETGRNKICIDDISC